MSDTEIEHLLAELEPFSSCIICTVTRQETDFSDRLHGAGIYRLYGREDDVMYHLRFKTERCQFETWGTDRKDVLKRMLDYINTL